MTARRPRCHVTGCKGRATITTGACGTHAPEVDPVAVDRAVQGTYTGTLTRDELALAWERLEAQGCSGRTIAQRLGVAPRTVHRWRTGQHTPKFRRKDHL